MSKIYVENKTCIADITPKTRGPSFLDNFRWTKFVWCACYGAYHTNI